MSLTILEKQELIRLDAERRRRASHRRLFSYRPYPKQVEFHNAGLTDEERLLMAGNQQGKTFCAAAECAMHLTGRYPKPGEVFYPTEAALRAQARTAQHGSFEQTEALGFLENLGELGLFGADVYPQGWQGRRFTRPISAWVGGKSSKETRDIVQAALLGDPEDVDKLGTGAIPKADLIEGGFTRLTGVPNAYDTVMIRHQSGGKSRLGFKSFDQGRERWQGTKRDLIWCDEEPPLSIYMEAKTRTNAANGIVLVTFTPLLGMSEVVRLFIHEEKELHV